MLSALSYVISETGLASGASSFDLSCDHRQHWPLFRVEGAHLLTVSQVRERWPRYASMCMACHQPCIIYASIEHMLAGGWHRH